MKDLIFVKLNFEYYQSILTTTTTSTTTTTALPTTTTVGIMPHSYETDKDFSIARFQWPARFFKRNP